jgi:hypothetical protein
MAVQSVAGASLTLILLDVSRSQPPRRVPVAMGGTRQP